MRAWQRVGSPLWAGRYALWALLLLVIASCTQANPSPSGNPVLSNEPSTPQPAPAAPTLLPPEPPPLGATAEFRTDFTKHSVSYREILSGGPPKDGIPSIDHPRFVSVDEAARWLRAREPVVLFVWNQEVRVYPIQILVWHEIVNDVVGDTPVLITFCPLCNTAIAFDRRVDGMVLEFGTTGRLRFSNLIMYDRQTESWWQQATGEAIVGALTGKRLRFLPATIVAWETVQQAYPNARVLSRDTGYSRPYGQNPYVGYDSVDTSPFLYQGPPTPGRLPPMARVLAVDLNGEAVAYPYQELAKVKVVNDVVGGTPIVVFWQAGVASPLDKVEIARGRDVGTAVAYARTVDGRMLTFRWDGVHFWDEETGSTWDVTGKAVAGPLAGATLTPVVSVNHFWFSWAAFRPETRVFTAEE